jgi:hypothetical protein
MQVDGGAEVRLLWSLNGQLAVNVFHARVGAGITINQGTADRLGAAYKTDITGTAGQLAMATTTRLEKVGLRDLRTDKNPEFLDAGPAVVGTAVGDPLPNHVALVVTLKTGKAGRSYQGRSYISGFSESHNSATGTADQTAQDGANNIVGAMFTTMLTESLTMTVLSREFEQTTIVKTVVHADGRPDTVTTRSYPARGDVMTDVTDILVRDAQWDTQRRRNNGKGAFIAAVSTLNARHFPLPQPA